MHAIDHEFEPGCPPRYLHAQDFAQAAKVLRSARHINSVDPQNNARNGREHNDVKEEPPLLVRLQFEIGFVEKHGEQEQPDQSP